MNIVILFLYILALIIKIEKGDYNLFLTITLNLIILTLNI